MLAVLRRSLNTWVARGFFLILVIAFASWGVGDMVRLLSRETWAARVAGQTIEMAQVQDAYRRQLSDLSRRLGGQTEPTVEMRRLVLQQVVDQLVTEIALTREIASAGFVVPDEALRDAIYKTPTFFGPNGQFDKTRFESYLQQSGFSEFRFLQLMRADLAVRQLAGAVSAGAYLPDSIMTDIFAYQQEKRSADMIEFAFAAAPDPAPPSEATLRRWWDNHPDAYSTPEYRRVKIVILSPDTMAADIKVSDEDVQAAYDQHKSEYVVPPRRSVEAIVVPAEAAAQELAAQWRAGASWDAMQTAAKAVGATAITLDDATAAEFPATELAAAVFAAPPDAVGEPVKTPLGWYVLRVVKADPGSNRSFADAKDELSAQIARDRAADLIYQRINAVEDAIAGDPSLDKLPSDLGIAGVTGTMDAHGMTPAGEPAAIPGAAPFREAIIQAAFRATQGEPPKLAEVPGPAGGTLGSYALAVESITPPAREPFEQVEDRVRADWTAATKRKTEEELAAKVLGAVEGGQTLADAATVAGVTVRRTPAIGRQAAAPEGVPPQLVRPLFDLKAGEATMIETPESFIVAAAAEVQPADPASDPIGAKALRERLAASVGSDLQNTMLQALRDRGHAEVNQALLETLVQP
jgi:peptidyl-prolyl cis-trans isomerase D